MILFSDEKGLIFNITNAILLIWFLGALVFVCNSAINVLLREPKYTYEEQKAMHCNYLDERKDLDTDEKLEAECQRVYDSYLYSYKNDDYYNKKSLYMSIANVVIVGGGMYLMNRKK